MATIAEVIEGLLILAKTAKTPDRLAENGVTDGMQASVETEYKILYVPGASPSKEDEYRLYWIGWRFDEDHEAWCMDT